MRMKYLLRFLWLVGLLLSACETNRSKLPIVEVTRIIREKHVVTVEVPYIIRETQIVTAEVTRIVRETVVVPPPLPPKLTVNINQGMPLQIPRAHHTITRLSDGRILVVGGSKSPDEHLADVEIFDPVYNSIAPVPPLHTPRDGHSATLLQDGRVLVVGGYSLPRQWLDDAEVYDPIRDTWTVVPPLHSHGVQHTATLMKDGRVLVVGGCIGSGVCTERVEIFNPQTNSWTEAMPLASDRASHTAQLLNDGRVLVAGGGAAGGIPAGGDAIVYDPHTNSWMPTGPMIKPRIFGQAARFPDGRVLLVGGVNLEDSLGGGPYRKMSTSAEIYSPTTNAWIAAADLPQARYENFLVQLLDGRVMVSGGARDWDCCWTNNSFVHEIEIYDPSIDQWLTAGNLLKPAASSAAVLLSDGRVWVTGGQIGKSSTTFLPDTWLILPVSLEP